MKNRRKGRGQTLVEFALILPVLLLLIFGIFEFGRIIFLYANLFNAAREGARYGMVDPLNYGEIHDHTQERISLAQVTSDQLTVWFDEGLTPGDPAPDEVGYPGCEWTATNDCTHLAVVGNRVVVGIVDYEISPITPLFEPIIRDLTLNTSSARTIQRVNTAAISPPPPTGPQPGDPGGDLPELSIAKSASPDPAAPGDTITYDITVTNNGTGDATNVTVSDDLDANTTLVAGTLSASSGTATASGNSITLDVSTLASGASVSVSYEATVNEPLPAGVTSITNAAGVTSAEDGPYNTEATISVDAGPVLQIAKSASPTYASPEDEILYAVQITNVGNQEDSSVTFSDTLPGDVSLIADSVGTTKGSATTSGNSFTVDVGTLASGASVDITFRATIAGSENFVTGENTIINDGIVTSSTYPGGVSDSATTVVTVGPHLDIRKSGRLYQDIDRDGTIGPGDILYFEIVVTNVGNQDATTVEVDDVLDDNTTMVPDSVTVSQGGYDSNNTKLDGHVGTLAPGAEATLSFRSEIEPIGFDVKAITNDATATCDELPSMTFESNRVSIPVISDPILIDKPVRVGDAFVEGTALASQALTFEILRSGVDPIPGSSDGDGNFRFDVSGLTLTEGDYVLVKGYGTQDIARVEAELVDPYIELTNEDCQADTVTVEGGNWEDTQPGPGNKYGSNVTVVLFCDGQAWYEAPYNWSGSFTYTGVPFTDQCPSSEAHIITGRVYYKGDEALTPEVSASMPILCPIEPDLPPDIKVEGMELVYPMTIAMVSPQIGTHEPLTVTVVLTNTTTTDVTTLFEVDLFVDPDPSAFLFEQASVDHVGVQVMEGASRISFEMYAPDGVSDTEPHTLTVKADTFEQITENDETNNIMDRMVTASYTNTAPIPTPIITSTLEPGAIQGETWIVIQNEILPQSGVEVYAETVITDTNNLTTTVTYGPIYSDNLGQYTLTDLPPATYTVTGEYELLEDPDNDGNLERVLYQNSIEVQVTSNMTTTGVYLILEPVGGL